MNSHHDRAAEREWLPRISLSSLDEEHFRSRRGNNVMGRFPIFNVLYSQYVKWNMVTESDVLALKSWLRIDRALPARHRSASRSTGQVHQGELVKSKDEACKETPAPSSSAPRMEVARMMNFDWWNHWLSIPWLEKEVYSQSRTAAQQSREPIIPLFRKSQNFERQHKVNIFFRIEMTFEVRCSAAVCSWIDTIRTNSLSTRWTRVCFDWRRAR